MDCVDGYIGIRHACEADKMSNPPSGLFIEDLEGINVHRLEGVNIGKWENAVEFVRSKTRHAFNLIAEEIRTTLEPHWAEKLILETGVGGMFDKDTYLNLANADYGLQIDIQNTNLRRVSVDEIWLLFEGDFSKKITITDGVRSMELNTEGAVIAKGQELTRIPVNFTSDTGVIRVLYNGLDLNARPGTTVETQLLAGCSTCGSVGYETFTVKGYNNGSVDDGLYGLAARVSVECSMDKAVCLLKGRYKMAILYRVGIEILKEWEASDRMNWLTIHSREWAAEKRAEWEEITVPSIMNNLASGAAFYLKRVDKGCLECGGTIYGYTHP